VRTSATLTCLSLDGNGIGDAGAASLGDALRANLALTALDLSNNNAIRAAGVAALTGALRTNATLTKLSLKGRNLVGGERS